VGESQQEVAEHLALPAPFPSSIPQTPGAPFTRIAAQILTPLNKHHINTYFLFSHYFEKI
jgi:hypothetical protein